MKRRASVLSPVRETRDPLIWLGDDTLDPTVKDFILGKLDEALIDVDESYLEYVKRVYIIGSITGRQYDDSSDVDTNVLIDTQAMAMEMGVESEALRKYLKDTLVSHNGESVPQTAHPLNFFLAVDDTLPPADGIYDVLEDVWVKKPEDDYPEDFDPYNSFRDAMERFETIADKIDTKWGQALRAERAWKTYDQSQHKRKMVRCLKALETIHEVLVADRHSIFDMVKKYGADPKEAQLSSSNVCYKAIELNGYLSKLKAAEEFLSQMSEGGEMSLEEMYGGRESFAGLQEISGNSYVFSYSDEPLTPNESKLWLSSSGDVYCWSSRGESHHGKAIIAMNNEGRRVDELSGEEFEDYEYYYGSKTRAKMMEQDWHIGETEKRTTGNYLLIIGGPALNDSQKAGIYSLLTEQPVIDNLEILNDVESFELNGLEQIESYLLSLNQLESV